MKLLNKIKRRVREDNERGAREAVIEDLFNDFNRSRFTIYKFNFFRGIFFGLGSVLGGTLVVALLVGLLNFTGHLVPGIADFLNSIIDMMQRTHR
jgi:hypothetical protein